MDHQPRQTRLPAVPSRVVPPMSPEAVRQACQRQCQQWTLLLNPLERLIPFNLETPYVQPAKDAF